MKTLINKYSQIRTTPPFQIIITNQTTLLLMALFLLFIQTTQAKTKLTGNFLLNNTISSIPLEREENNLYNNKSEKEGDVTSISNNSKNTSKNSTFREVANDDFKNIEEGSNTTQFYYILEQNFKNAISLENIAVANQPFPNPDTDGDGITDDIDVDDDNDGILDVDEHYASNLTINGITDYNIINNPSIGSGIEVINDGDISPDNGIAHNKTAHYFVIDLGRTLNTNSMIKFDWWTTSGSNRQHTISQISSDTYNASGGSNPLIINYTDSSSSGDFTYTLDTPTRYIQVDMTQRTSGRVEMLEATIITAIYLEDLDSDGIPNRLDLDADGDGCSDALEAGATTNTTANYVFTGAVGANGLVDTLETFVDSGIVNYTSTYNPYAVSDFLAGCVDKDYDGVNDLLDIDDDNDGVLDTEEGICNLSGEQNLLLDDVTLSGDNSPAKSTVTNYVAQQTPAGNPEPSGLTFVNGYDNTNNNSNLLMTITFNNPTTFNIANNELTIKFQYYNNIANTTSENITKDPSFNIETDAGDYFVEHTLTAAEKTSLQNGNWIPIEFTIAIAQSTVTINSMEVNLESISGGYSSSFNAASSEVFALAIDGIQTGNSCTDTDGDGIPNSLDLDSDNDGCSDALEAGATTNTTADYVFTGAVGANGLVDALETSVDSGTINYTSTYNPNAVSDFLAGCVDTDSDGVNDLLDIDDDNDGILDATESPSCFYLANEFENGDRTEFVEVTTTLSMDANYNDPNETVDGANGTGIADYAVRFNNDQSATDQTVYQFEFQQAVELSTIYIGYRNGDSHFINGASIKLQASNNNATWEDVNDGATYNQANSNSNVPSVGTIRNQAFEVTKNAGVYKYYRIQGVSGTIWRGGESNEIYFETNNLNASLYLKDNCSVDTDNDGTYNHLDTDSDGDTCIDTIEAGTSNDGTTTDANNNGLLDQYEDGTTGTINYESTYNAYAINDAINACADTDGDGIGDLIDLDDDNDGILDTVELLSINAALWLDASDPSSIIKDSNGLVSQWNDKSGNGHHATQSTTDNQPTTNSRQQSGLNVIDFDGNDLIRNPSFDINTTDLTVFSVRKWDTNVSDDRVWTIHNLSNENLGKLNEAGTKIGYRSPTNRAVSYSANLNLELLSFKANGTNSQKIWVNGLYEAENTGAVTPFTSNAITIGADNAGNSFDGIVAEVIIVESSMSDNDRQKIEGYLAHKWGLAANLPDGHPYKDAAPSLDVDGDNIPNSRDLDSDGDGIPDNIEAQTTAGYTVPGNTIDNTTGINTTYGSGLTPIDTDADGTPDFLDIDSDNDQDNDNTEAGVTLSGLDDDSDGLDDAIDTDDNNFGPVNAGITDVLNAYPDTTALNDASLVDVLWRVDCEFGKITEEQYVIAATGNANADWGENDGVIGAPDEIGSGIKEKRISLRGINNPITLTYQDIFSGGATITFYGRHWSGSYVDGFTIAFSEDNSTWTSESSSQNIGSTSYTTLNYTIPNNFSGNYKYIRLTSDNVGPNSTLSLFDAVKVTYEVCNDCPTGVNAPALSAITITNDCTDTVNPQTMDLTSITASNQPANTTLTWHTGVPATEANKVSAPATAVAGIYYASFYSEAGSCYTLDGEAVTAVTADGDSDCDGVPDSTDIDDDNDGILNATESPSCFYLANEFENGDRTEFVEVTTTLSMNANYNDPNETVDGANGTGTTDYAVRFTNDQSATDQTVYQFEFQQAVELSTIYIGYRNGDSHFINGASIKLQASNNNATWEDVNDGATYNQANSNSNVPSVGTIRNQAFEVTKNAGVYKYYRIQGVSGTIWGGGESNEIYFETNNFNASLYPKDNCSVDTDGDGTPNSLDLDSDNDGILDNIEAQNYSSYIAPSGIGSEITDINGNGLDDVYESTPGVGLTPVNSDTDSLENFVDIDADNDGIPDNVELQRTKLYIAPSGIATSITDVNSNGVDDNYEIGGTVGIIPVDTELDGIPDYVDTDTDNDGLLDIAENGNSNNVTSGTDTDNDGLDDNFDNYDDTNISGHTVNNGINPPSASNLGDSDNDLETDGDVDFRDNVNTILITQVYQSAGKKMIEVTNIGADQIPGGTFTLNLFSNNSGDMTGLTPSASYTITSTLNANQSIVIENNAGGGFSNINSGAISITDDNITNFSDGNDILVLSTTSDNTSWTNRLDVIHSVNNITSVVLKDEESNPVAANDPNRWSVFIDDNLDPYRPGADGGAERHPHDPLMSDILNASENSNMQLGYHRSGETVRIAGAWNNGIPDRSRRVIINEDYLHNDGSHLSARQLTIDNNSKLTIQDKLLIVSDLVTITGINDEIRLAGSRSQLITTHSRNSGINGNGKLYIDQNSDIPSTYRYNYFSSPVTTVGENTFSVASVMKDGSIATSPDSNAMDMNWTNDIDGETTSPITIADYWIYSFGSSGNWSQLRKDGQLLPANGFTLKGPGQEQNYTFEGTPNDGLIKTTVSYKTSYLVGNPYPSAIDSKKFLEDNIESIYGTIYFWEHHPGLTEENDEGHYSSNYVGGYATRNLTMGIAAPNNGDGNIVFRVPGKYIPIAQGFFITGSNTGGEVVFKNSQREYRYEGDDSIFFRDGENNEVSETYQDPVLKIGLDYTNSNNQHLHRQVGVSFNKDRSFSFDLGYDSPLYEPLENDIQYRVEETKMFWKFDQDDTKYVIAGIQEFSTDIEIPIGFSLEYDGEIIVKLDEQQNFEQDVYLKDEVTGATYKLSDNEQGVVITLAAGSHLDKYSIVFVESSLSIDDDILLENQLGVYVDNSANELVIKNYTNLDIKKLGLYNILGQSIKTWNNLGTEQEYRMETKIPAGIYIVRVTLEEGQIVKKIRVD